MEYDGGGGSTEMWTIDDAYLESAVKELEALGRFVDEHVLPRFADIAQRTGTSNHSPFGGNTVTDAAALWQRHDLFLSSARRTYQTLANQLADTAEATREIAQRYRRTEDRNTANVQEIEKIFNSHTDGASTGPSAPAPASNPGGGF